jgi:threonine dehydratase
LEILNDVVSDLDYVFIPVGGGSLAAGISEVFKQLSPETKLIGVESELAPAMSTSLAKGEIVKLEDISRFCDGSAVHRVGEICFSQLKKHLTKVITVPEGLISKTILKLYNLGIVAEPAGAMAIAGMEMLKSELVGKEIAVVISGSNTKLLRVDEFIEKALVYEGLKYMILV